MAATAVQSAGPFGNAMALVHGAMAEAQAQQSLSSLAAAAGLTKPAVAASPTTAAAPQDSKKFAADALVEFAKLATGTPAGTPADGADKKSDLDEKHKAMLNTIAEAVGATVQSAAEKKKQKKKKKQRKTDGQGGSTSVTTANLDELLEKIQYP